METINLQMTWQAAAKIMILALENGTEEGKKIAREEIIKMAKILDNNLSINKTKQNESKRNNSKTRTT